MDLEHKLGQLFLLGFQGDTLETNSTIFHDISKRNLGGVILFDRLLAKNQANNNIINSQQVKNLTVALQECASNELLIAVDQEGGKVCRLTCNRGFPDTPTAEELGNNKNLGKTEKASRQTAELLSSLGITLNLAPVVDVNCFKENPIIAKYGRSFSHNPAQVTKYARSWIQAHREQGILTCIKHFPGHGSARHDSHLGFVNITETWQQSELTPFSDLIASGDVDAIMTGHLFNGQLDPEYPATLSQKTLSSLLKKDLKFEGALISDDMQMKAITDRYGLEQAVCLAVIAGVDLVIIGNNLEYDENILEKLISSLLHAVEDRTLSEERIDDAYCRVQSLKKGTRGK
jgi:beta-N-acetylhexosaminidase